MNSSKKQKFQHDEQLNNSHHSDDQLSNEWQLHSNRLIYLEQSLLKLQKKLLKLEKAFTFVSDSSNSLKEEFKSKLNQMISTLTQQNNYQSIPPGNDDIQQLKQQFKKVQTLQLQSAFKQANIQKEVQKLLEKQTDELNLVKIQDYINDRFALFEQKNKKFVEQKISELSKKLHALKENYQASFKLLPQHSNNLQSNIQNNIALNASTLTKDGSFHQNYNMLSNSRSQKKILSSLKSSNLFDYSQNTVQQNIASKRLNFFSEENNKYSELGTSRAQKTSQQQNGAPTSQNSSRVVYLRQKLKQFEEINKKYEKKQSQFDKKQRQIVSVGKTPLSQRSLSTKKNVNSFSKNNQQKIYLESHPEYGSTQFITVSREKNNNYLNTFLLRESPSTAKPEAFSSTNKSNLITSNSAKKIDKLKNIKDYLQQTESDFEDSFLEPNSKQTNF